VGEVVKVSNFDLVYSFSHLLGSMLTNHTHRTMILLSKRHPLGRRLCWKVFPDISFW